MAELRCPYCRSRVDPADSTVLACVDCGAAHHLGCVGESATRRCATCEGSLKGAPTTSRVQDWQVAAAMERRHPYQPSVPLQEPREEPLWQKVGAALLVIAICAVIGGFLGAAASSRRAKRTIYAGPGAWETYDNGWRWQGFPYGAAGGVVLAGVMLAGVYNTQRPRRVLKRRPVGTPKQAYGEDYRYTGRVNRALPVPDLLAPLLAWAQVAVDARRVPRVSRPAPPAKEATASSTSRRAASPRVRGVRSS
ncbi:MAG: hypothetical protein AB7N76_02500 [Planctomycetota bacterium]